jgi:hypothetical protein
VNREDKSERKNNRKETYQEELTYVRRFGHVHIPVRVVIELPVQRPDRLELDLLQVALLVTAFAQPVDERCKFR